MLECWSDSLYHVGVCHGTLSPACLISLSRSGSHPFDYERRPLSYWATITNQDADEYSQQGSANETLENTKLKEKIIRGDVEYFQDPWMELPDGLLNIVPSCSPSDQVCCLARNLVVSLLIRDSRERATVYSALESHWIQSEISDLKSLYRSRVMSLDD